MTAFWRAVFTCLLLAVALCCATGRGAAPAFAQAALPALSGRVVNQAALLDPACVQKLTAKLAQWEGKTGDQLAVVTVPSLAGEDVESFSNRLFRHWALGEAKINNGILLVVAPNDRQVRIEVGYGLEGTLTDALSSVIIHTWLIPAFRDGNYCLGVQEGVDAILAVLTGDQAGFEERLREKRAADAAHAEQAETVSDIVGLIVAGIFIFIAPLLAAIFGRKIGPNRYLWLGIVFTLGGYSGGGGGGSSGGGGASGTW